MESISWTNQDATQCKLSCVQANYFNDPFITEFIGTTRRRSPEINRGTWARLAAVQHLVQRFVQMNPTHAQIVNMGAGFDTLYWRLKSDSSQFSNYVDVEINLVANQKKSLIMKSSKLKQYLDDSDFESPAEIHSKGYHLIGCDATKSQKLLQILLNKCGINKEEPIVFVFECVLCYWSVDTVNTVLYSLSKFFPQCSLIIYECLFMNDSFSSVMNESLRVRNTPLLAALNSLQQQCERCSNNGFVHVFCKDMNCIFQEFLEEHQKIEKLEFLDEKELLQQLLDHYCIVFASNFQVCSWS